MASDLAVRFLVADPGQVGEVVAVLDEAAAWLHGRGVEQWPSRFEPSWVEGAVRRGETWLALAGGTVSGTVMSPSPALQASGSMRGRSPS